MFFSPSFTVWWELTANGTSYWYRMMFDEHFPPTCASTVERWTPTWSKQTDPSGRYDLLTLCTCEATMDYFC